MYRYLLGVEYQTSFFLFFFFLVCVSMAEANPAGKVKTAFIKGCLSYKIESITSHEKSKSHMMACELAARNFKMEPVPSDVRFNS